MTDYEMANTGQNTQSEGSNIRKKVHLMWTADRDDVLLDALLDEQSKGNRINGSWTTSAYINVEKVLQEKLGNNYMKAHVKNKMKTLKTNFNLCYELFRGLSGFSWNPTTQLFEAEEEVWKDLLEVISSNVMFIISSMLDYSFMYYVDSKSRRH